MDQVVATHELEYQPSQGMALALGYDREAIDFLGISRLKGIGFRHLRALRGSVQKLVGSRGNCGSSI